MKAAMNKKPTAGIAVVKSYLKRKGIEFIDLANGAVRVPVYPSQRDTVSMLIDYVDDYQALVVHVHGNIKMDGGQRVLVLECINQLNWSSVMGKLCLAPTDRQLQYHVFYFVDVSELAKNSLNLLLSRAVKTYSDNSTLIQNIVDATGATMGQKPKPRAKSATGDGK